MNLQKRDLVATGFVAVAGVLYLLWLLDAVPTSMSSVRTTGAIILALGFAASATAVVPTFGQLLHGSKVYMAGTSLLGLVALVAGIVMLVGESETALAILMVAMVVLWAIATTHHSRLARVTSLEPAHLGSGAERPKVGV